MDRFKKIRVFEISLYAIVLLASLSVPFFMGTYGREGWLGILIDWVRLLPFVCVFLLNNFLLVPRLVYKEKYWQYIVLCMVFVVSFSFISDYLFEKSRMIPPPFEKIEEHHIPRSDEMRMPPSGHNHAFRPKHKGGPPPHNHFNLGIAIISFLIIGFNTGTKSFVRWNEERIRQSEKEKQHLFTELAFLKHQISPHFFMNTLNNIHALIDIDTERAKDAIIKLSRLMRYLLYESDEESVSLKKEVEFMESYIELMRLRYHEQDLEIQMVSPENRENIRVPAFLFLSLIENAFKHGVKPGTQSYIKIVFSFKEEEKLLCLSIENGKHPVHEGTHEASGIGHENLRKRLDLLYKDRYRLEISDEEKSFRVYLEIPDINIF